MSHMSKQTLAQQRGMQQQNVLKDVQSCVQAELAKSKAELAAQVFEVRRCNLQGV